MATYRVYQDFGDFGVESTIEASCIAEAIRKIAPTRAKGCVYCFRLNGEYLGDMTVNEFGNVTIELLDMVLHSPDVAYATRVMKEYFLNGCYDLCPAGSPCID